VATLKTPFFGGQERDLYVMQLKTQGERKRTRHMATLKTQGERKTGRAAQRGETGKGGEAGLYLVDLVCIVIGECGSKRHF